MSDKGSPPRTIDNLATNPLSPSASLLSPEESPDRTTTNNPTGDTYNLGTDVLSPGNFSIDEEDDSSGDDNNSPPSRQLSTDDGSVSSRKSKKGESSAKLMKLSNKTTKIMSDYQAYLTEIESEFPGSSNSDDDSSSKRSTDKARDNIRTSYNNALEEGSINFSSQSVGSGGSFGNNNSSYGKGGKSSGVANLNLRRSSIDDEEERPSAAGLTVAGFNMEPLARAWDYSRTITIGPLATINTTSTTEGGTFHDDGITDITDYESQMQLARGQKYTHPWFHSKRVKRGICVFIGLCTLIGLSVGITKNSKDKKMDMLEGEMVNSSTETKDSEEGGGGVFNGVEWDETEIMSGMTTNEGEEGEESSEWKNSPKYQTNKLYEDAAMKYKPLEFNRKKGWKGQSYTEALIFCGQKPGYGVCPYEAICPNGSDVEPLGGYKNDGDEDSWNWMPISNSPNDWVAVGSNDSCIQYSHMHPDSPEWGIDGQDNEAGTTNIMCCLGPNTMSMIDNKEMSLVQVNDYFAPKSFNRESGYTGQSFHEALQYCKAIDGYDLCPYSAICPNGPDSKPMGGVRDSEKAQDPNDNGVWIPVLDTINEWVQVSAQGETCIAYSHTHPDRPDWGMTGKNEAITREVMCCLEQTDGTYFEQAVLYQMAVEKYHPHLFDRDVWKGQTFIEAIEFCEDIEGYSLCPYEAICPLGTDTQPISGYQDGPTKGKHAGQGTWAPFMGGNEWVQLSEDNGCIPYSHLHKNPPKWGESGEGNEDITQHILCCAKPGMFDPNAVLKPVVHQSTGGVGKPVEETPRPQSLPPPPSAELMPIDANAQTYSDAAVKYVPKWYNRNKGWKGSTYLEALQFCADSDAKYELCPLIAICPLGEDSEPLGGYRESSSGSWVPINDKGNDWVQVSKHGSADRPCVRYDHENAGDAPQWGLSGDNEEVTSHVACCLIQDGMPAISIAMESAKEEAMHIKEEISKEGEIDEEIMQIAAGGDADGNDAYVEAARKYDPTWFNREMGWSGTTYLEATEYCELEGDREVCAFEAICPMGLYSEPIGGFRDVETPGGVAAYVPIKDKSNDWVQVSLSGGIPGTEHGTPCMPWSYNHESQPVWGVSGDGNDDLTHHIVCCTKVEPNIETPVVSESDATPPPPDTTIATTDDYNTQVFKAINEEYQPQWFDRSNGWTGTTQAEAFAFCVDFNKKMPCPYEALCPLGRGSEPLGGYKSNSWLPMMDGTNSWVNVDENDSCVEYTHLHPSPPSWGVDGSNDEQTQNLACCTIPTQAPTKSPVTSSPTMRPSPSPTNIPTRPPSLEPTAKPIVGDDYYYESMATAYEPLWFDRSQGWSGTTYLEGIHFCARQDSRVPCPYQAVCPVGKKEGVLPLGDVKEGVSWAPIIDSPNAWVQVGKEDTCSLYTDLFPSPPAWGLSGIDSEDLTRNIMCCLETPKLPEDPKETDKQGELTPFNEQEQIVLDVFKAQWFGREDGYSGTTYEDAAEFCNNVNGMELCPLLAYCPNGPVNELGGKPLFLQLPAFEGEQWSPIAATNDGDDYYVLTGTINGNPTTTCHTYRSFNDGKIPQWGLDGSEHGKKLYTMCCKDPSYISKGIKNPAVDYSLGRPEISAAQIAQEGFDVQALIEKEIQPRWYGVVDGWNGGSHADAAAFCNGFKDRQLCPYAAYCPHGPGQPISSGHTTDISAEGLQWAPVFGAANHWVMVGMKDGNSATTCFGHEDLEGETPTWGLSSDMHQIKEHIMCCSSTQ